MKTEFTFVKEKNKLWIETDNIGMVFGEKDGKPVRVAIKLEGKDLLKLYKTLEKIGFPFL